MVQCWPCWLSDVLTQHFYNTLQTIHLKALSGDMHIEKRAKLTPVATGPEGKGPLRRRLYLGGFALPKPPATHAMQGGVVAVGGGGSCY